MPIKEISKEEQSHLYLAGMAKREHLHLTETDRGESGHIIDKGRNETPITVIAGIPPLKPQIYSTHYK